MKSFAIFRVAVRALRRNKMRTILTMLGLIIGVGAVIATVSLGNGAKAQVEAQIASLGQNVVLVYSGSFNRGGVRSGFGGAGTLTIDDANAIAARGSRSHRHQPGTDVPAPRSPSAIRTGSPQLRGESETYLDIRQWPLAEAKHVHRTGRARRQQGRASSARPSSPIFFRTLMPSAQVIRIKNVPFTIVGVLVPKGLSVQGQDQDDVIIMPYTSLMKRLQGVTTLRTINVQAVSANALDSVQQQIMDLLRQRHRTTP